LSKTICMETQTHAQNIVLVESEGAGNGRHKTEAGATAGARAQHAEKVAARRGPSSSSYLADAEGEREDEMLPDADRVTEAEGEGEGDVDRVALVVTVTLGVKLGDEVRLVVGVGLRDVDGVTAEHHQHESQRNPHTHATPTGVFHRHHAASTFRTTHVAEHLHIHSTWL
jgi:hypothetical protein